MFSHRYSNAYSYSQNTEMTMILLIIIISMSDHVEHEALFLKHSHLEVDSW